MNLYSKNASKKRRKLINLIKNYTDFSEKYQIIQQNRKFVSDEESKESFYEKYYAGKKLMKHILNKNPTEQDMDYLIHYGID